MLIKLKRRLFLLLTGSVMLIFTIVFCLLIYENTGSKKNMELSFFNRMITTLILQLEHRPDYGACLKLYEEKLDMSFQLLSDTGALLYRSELTDEQLVDCFLSEQLSREGDFTVNPATLSEATFFSRQGGVYTIKSSDGKDYYCVSCLIVTDHNEVYSLVTVKKCSGFAALLMPGIVYYAGIWCCVLLSILFLSKILVQIAVKPAEAAVQSQKDFIASVSHECKAPLAVMLSSAEIIDAMPDATASIKKYTNIIDQEATRMSRLIQDLLLLSSLDAGSWSFHMEETDMDTLMIHLYEKFESICSGKNITLRLELPEESCPPVLCDSDRLNQLIGIFLDNAIACSQPESEILLRAENTKKEFIVTVIDHGTGISDQDKPFVFDRFYQCVNSHKEHFGLGLSIARELVRKLGGKIQLSDSSGGGCTFRIFLPLM